MDNVTTRRLLEQDRKVELKMRLAMKRMHGQMSGGKTPHEMNGKPEPEVVGKLIAAVRDL